MSQGNFGNLCDTDNFGDPVVLYDSFEDRWIITDFAFRLHASGNVVNPPASSSVSPSRRRRSGRRRLELLLDPGSRRPRRLSEVRHLARWPLHVGEHVHLFASARIHGRSRLGDQQGADVCRCAQRPGSRFRARYVRLHAASGQLEAADWHATDGSAGVLRFDGAVPECPDGLQVPRRLEQRGQLNLQRAGYSGSAELLAQLNPGERHDAFKLPRCPRSPRDGPGPIHEFEQRRVAVGRPHRESRHVHRPPMRPQQQQ